MASTYFQRPSRRAVRLYGLIVSLIALAALAVLAIANTHISQHSSAALKPGDPVQLRFSSSRRSLGDRQVSSPDTAGDGTLASGRNVPVILPSQPTTPQQAQVGSKETGATVTISSGTAGGGALPPHEPGPSGPTTEAPALEQSRGAPRENLAAPVVEPLYSSVNSLTRYPLTDHNVELGKGCGNAIDTPLHVLMRGHD